MNNAVIQVFLESHETSSDFVTYNSVFSKNKHWVLVCDWKSPVRLARCQGNLVTVAVYIERATCKGNTLGVPLLGNHTSGVLTRSSRHSIGYEYCTVWPGPVYTVVLGYTTAGAVLFIVAPSNTHKHLTLEGARDN